MLAFFKGLGIGFLCLILFVAGVIFNVEFLHKSTQTLKLSRNIVSSMQAKPDIFQANIDFWANENLSTQTSLSNKDKLEISRSFSQILERSKKEDFCSGGSFSLEPNFSYKDGTQSGYKLNANLQCEFKTDELENFNKLFNDFNSIVSKSEFIGISIPALEAKFSKQSLRDNEEKLYKDLIKKAYSYEKIYSLELDRTCMLESLDIQALSNFYPRALSAKSAHSIELSLPIVKDKEQSISAKASFTCK